MTGSGSRRARPSESIAATAAAHVRGRTADDARHRAAREPRARCPPGGEAQERRHDRDPAGAVVDEQARAAGRAAGGHRPVAAEVGARRRRVRSRCASSASRRRRGSVTMSSKRSISVALSSTGARRARPARGADPLAVVAASARAHGATSASSRCCWKRGELLARPALARAERGERSAMASTASLIGVISSASGLASREPCPSRAGASDGSSGATTSGCVSRSRPSPVAHRDQRGGELRRSRAGARSRARPRGGQRADERLHRAPVELGEARPVLGVAEHVRPELEEDGEPAVVAVAPRGGRGDLLADGGVHVGGLRHVRGRSRASARRGARRRRRTGPPWRRSSSRPRPWCSRPRRRRRRARWRGSRRR